MRVSKVKAVREAGAVGKRVSRIEEQEDVESTSAYRNRLLLANFPGYAAGQSAPVQDAKSPTELTEGNHQRACPTPRRTGRGRNQIAGKLRSVNVGQTFLSVLRGRGQGGRRGG